MNITRPVAGAAVAALLIAACGGGDDDAADSTSTTEAATTTTTDAPETTTTEVETTTTSSTTSSTTTTTTVPVVHRQPLTGEPVDSEADILQRPALAVKIDNAPPARRNHSGLAVADIVFEEIVEADITRFAAVFHSQGSERVGPIRSGRTQDINMLRTFNEPLFAWSGGNPAVTAAIASSPLTDLNPFRGHGAAYYRGPGARPHNFYSSTDRLWEETPPDHPGPPKPQYQYRDADVEFPGEPTGGAAVQMGSIDVEWIWDPEAGAFARRQEGSDHIDAIHGPITATNVVVMGVNYRPSPADARSPEAQTVGNGPVYVFSEGKVIEGRWLREGPLFPALLLDEDGNNIELTPGNTWIELARVIPTDDPANPAVPIEIFPAQ